MYKENPKTRGSGILACIPQKGICPNKCEDCFFQSGRSYLEPLSDNLPNMPSAELAQGKVIRVNDGNDSNVNRKSTQKAASIYPMRFYNTAINKDLSLFDAPVVLTINPGKQTDESWTKVAPIPRNLMFVRFRANTWNVHHYLLADEAIEYYSAHEIPVILTFMAYYDESSIPCMHKENYIYRKRTLNSYWAITTKAWEGVMGCYKYNKWVHSCGKIEGEMGATGCKFCGNCLREYFATMERMK
jgi:hypothetical protein